MNPTGLQILWTRYRHCGEGTRAQLDFVMSLSQEESDWLGAMIAIVQEERVKQSQWTVAIMKTAMADVLDLSGRLLNNERREDGA